MKLNYLILSLTLLIAGCTRPVIQEEAKEYENVDFTAVVVSDLHYVSSPSARGSVIPLESLGNEVTAALIAQCIDLSADAFIMTGDNTNNCREEEVKELSQKLKKLKDAGIEIIVIPGNHDYGQGSMKPYEEYILPLLHAEEKDPSSFSYITHVNGAAIYAMDDSHPEGSGGYFSEETMNWLKNHLNHEQSRILFLSHHNVLSGIAEPMYSDYLIQNKDLYHLLKSSGVRLCISGHQHNQSVCRYENMYEILSGIPFSSSHTFGLLKMNDEGVSYQTAEIDLEKYGEEGLKEKANALISEQNERFSSTFEKLCDEKNLSREDKAKVIALIMRFFDAYDKGILSDRAKDILNDPSYALMQEVLWDKNYGPWMDALLKNPPMNGSSLSFRWNGE